MAYIDPDGMFGGDRMAMLTDRARFFWPWIWVASNTVGRIELNYRKISDTVFRQFNHRPTEEQFWALIKEFHDCYLMFVYHHNGHVWGQWDVSEKYLPQYKMKADVATPAPIGTDFVAWREKYYDLKKSSTLAKCPIPNVFEHFANIFTGEERRDVDVGEDIKPSCAKKPRIRRNGNGATSEFEHWLNEAHDAWYESYWRHVGRGNSRSAFGKRVKELMRTAMTKDQAVEFLTQQAAEDQKRFQGTSEWTWRQKLHPSTWLNGERWKDEAPPADLMAISRKLSVNDEAKLLWDEQHGKQSNGN